MILGRLVGTVWATKKNCRLQDLKLALVRPYFWYNPSHDIDHVVAVDQVGADIGQDVLVCMGQPGRWEAGDCRTPVEASIMAIVDDVKIAPAAFKDEQVPFALREGFRPVTLDLADEATMAEERRV